MGARVKATIITNEGTFNLEDPRQLVGAVFGMVGRLKRKVVGRPQVHRNKIFRIVKQNIRENLEAGRAGGLGWPKLKKYTYAIRAIKGYPIQKYPMLRRTGALERGFKKANLEIMKIDKNRVQFTMFNSVPYAALQHSGGTVSADLVSLKSQYGRKHHKILLNPGEKVKTAGRFKAYNNTTRKRITVRVPARPCAFFNNDAIKRLMAGEIVKAGSYAYYAIDKKKLEDFDAIADVVHNLRKPKGKT